MKLQSREIFPPLFLAPMAGLTHSALRTLLLSFGGVGLLSTEMLSARRLPVENDAISPYLTRTPIETPLSYQLFLTAEKEIAPAIDALHRFGADSIDLNLGCPAPRVRKAGGGSSLMTTPELVRTLVASTRKQTGLPLTAKIRLGETLNAEKLRDFCLMLQGEGIDLLTVHARLRGESFCRKPRWEWVGRVKDWLSIPVVANGSIFSVDDARKCLQASGADGLMIGRAAAQSPWLFADMAKEVYGADISLREISLPGIYGQFVQALVERFRPERRLGRLKEFTHYFALNYPFGHHLASRVQSSRSVEEACTRAVIFFEQSDPKQVDELKAIIATLPLPSQKEH
ncbi:MAG: tRNA-dihydrouridine synthase family protein [Desulfobulbaceae bacterium]|nr:tRNA-dihydrouridine synthase family protein [Desulfobulbaceae bacterium]